MTYEALLALAKQMSMNLRQLADVEGKVGRFDVLPGPSEQY